MGDVSHHGLREALPDMIAKKKKRIGELTSTWRPDHPQREQLEYILKMTEEMEAAGNLAAANLQLEIMVESLERRARKAGLLK